MNLRVKTEEISERMLQSANVFLDPKPLIEYTAASVLNFYAFFMMAAVNAHRFNKHIQTFNNGCPYTLYSSPNKNEENHYETTTTAGE